jgi:hypothetical protein
MNKLNTLTNKALAANSAVASFGLFSVAPVVIIGKPAAKLNSLWFSPNT